MQDLITDSEPTMGSLELLEIINKERRDAGQVEARRNHFHDRVSDELEGEHYQKMVVENLNGTTTTAFILSKDQCMLVAMRESKAVRRNVLERLKRLDAKPKEPTWIANLSPQARVAIADLNQQVEQQQALIEAQKPAVDFAERVSLADKGVKLGVFAKASGLGPVKIFEILRDMGILMRGGDRHNLPKQEYIDRGYFQVRQTTYEANEETRIGHTPLITGKGEQWLTGRLLKEGVLKAVAH
jgi:phage antirepressor YoqD-like protein